ncbi:DMT family transporter [Haloprofundus halobius]|uniref:DMT family transporter n=1 Tax=Haloprofundus halobius TaxID=2876194 RepID=UPI001CCDBBEE|nr:DMT family transporter [Haloprofundus halobius]
MDSRHRNTGLFLAAATLTGGMYVANRAGLPHLPPVFFASLRFLVAATLLLPYVALRSEPLRPQTRTDYLTILVSGGLVVGAANVFLFVGQQYTTSATAAVLISLSPILAVGFAAVALPSARLTRRGVTGVALGLVGVAIVANPEPSSRFSVTMVGIGLLFLSAVSLAVGGVALRYVEDSLSPLAMTAWATLVGGAAMLVLSLARGEPVQTASWTTVAVLAVVYNGVVATPVGYVAYFSLLEAVGPIRVNLLTYVSPLVTALFGWLLLDERLSVLTLVGFGVIATGFVLIEYRSLSQEVARLRRALS